MEVQILLGIPLSWAGEVAPWLGAAGALANHLSPVPSTYVVAYKSYNFSFPRCLKDGSNISILHMKSWLFGSNKVEVHSLLLISPLQDNFTKGKMEAYVFF